MRENNKIYYNKHQRHKRREITQLLFVSIHCRIRLTQRLQHLTTQ